MDNCRYHSKNAASWFCSECNIDYCTTCIPGGESNFNRSEPRCPCCEAPLQWLGSFRHAEPFWRISHRFFTYGAQPMIIGLTVAMALVSLLVPKGLIGLGIGLLMFGVVIRYGLNIIARMAQGDWKAPGLSSAAGGEEHLYLKQIAVYVILFIGAGLAGGVPLLGLVALLFVNLALPASTMVLALTQSVGQAVNPLQLSALMLRIGWPYLLLWFTVNLVTSGPYIMFYLGGENLPAAVAFPLFAATTFHFSVVAFAMMGYVLYQKKGELGFANDEDRGRNLEPDQYLRQHALGASNVMIRENQVEKARKTLNDGLAKFPGDAELHERMHRLLMLMGDAKGVSRHSDFFCKMLVQHGNAGSAMRIFHDARTTVQDYVPEDAEVCHQVGKALFTQNKALEAKQVLVNLHKRAPDYAALDQAYLLLAKICSEGLQDDATALKLTDWLQKKYPGTDVANEAAAYQQTLSQMTTQRAAGQ